jgi:hypothetical protein
VNEQNRTLPYSDDVVAAWREQLAEAAENPWLAELLLKYGERILRRFTYFYEQLQTLSRRARRYIQRKLALSLSAAALLLALSGMYVPVAYAAGINVDPGEVDVSDNDACSLIEAIENANDTADGLVYDDCAAGDFTGADTINLPGGSTFILTKYHNNDYGPTGLPVISSDITIEGNGATIERDSGAAYQFRIFAVGYGDLTLNDATITGGRATEDGAPSYNWPTDGGGVLNYHGEVTITDSTISGNTAVARGGGVYNNGTLTITNSTISHNTSLAVDGGGVANEGGEATITNSIISDNDADGGGGVANDGGEVTIENSTISGNHAKAIGGPGGGVLNFDGEVTIENSTISGNTADERGGGVCNEAWDAPAIVRITNSTISGNTAYSDGGGVWNLAYDEEVVATVSIAHSTISGNTAAEHGGGVWNRYFGRVYFSHSIVSGNTANDGREVYNYGYAYADYFNLFGDSSETNSEAFSGFWPWGSDITATSNGTDPTALGGILWPLADNGGPTETHALFPGSPALDAGDPDFDPPPEYDQRGPGFPRVLNDVIDIGAYEGYKVPVGGFTAPANGLEQLAPATGLLAALVALATSGVALVKRRRE